MHVVRGMVRDLGPLHCPLTFSRSLRLLNPLLMLGTLGVPGEKSREKNETKVGGYTLHVQDVCI